MRLLLLNGYSAFVEEDEKVLLINCGGGYTVKYLMPPNCTLVVQMINVIYAYFTTIKKELNSSFNSSFSKPQRHHL